MKNIYLDRYAWPGPIIIKEPEVGTKLIIVIPCYNEPNILDALVSLYNGIDPGCNFETIVVINHGEHADQKIKDFNIETALEIEKWIENKKESSVYVIRAFDLPQKHAGVGLARKIGMDEAVRRFEYLGDKKGIITCFDADCLCSANYLQEIHRFYYILPNTNVALVNFEHPLEGDLSKEVYDSIVNYELHLRYYKGAQKFCQLPYSYHTVGSCITVTSESYQKQGGMNKKKAGEDFYFLQKLFPHGGVRNINKAIVFPSPRPSNRVPFGTGKAVIEMMNNKNDNYLTYNPKSFVDLKFFVEVISLFYQENETQSIIINLPKSIQEFLIGIDFNNNLDKIKKNSTSENQFLKSFFQWFNGFTVLKYVHFARDNYYENIEVSEAVYWLIEELNGIKIHNKRDALIFLREVDSLDQ